MALGMEIDVMAPEMHAVDLFETLCVSPVAQRKHCNRLANFCNPRVLSGLWWPG